MPGPQTSGPACGRRVYSLRVVHFGQSGDIPGLYREHGIVAAAGDIDEGPAGCTGACI